MILLWGLSGDGPFDRVYAALQKRRAPMAIVDQREVLRTKVELQLTDRLHASVRFDGKKFALDDMQSAYWRTYDTRKLPAVLETNAERSDVAALGSALAVEEALVVWLEMTTACVVNRPSDMASNGSKPYQEEILRAQGFEVPKTIVTTDPDSALRFWTDHGCVIYKSISGMRSVVSRLSPSHLQRIENLTWCPTQFQQFVPGRDHRVHVVGDDVFACEVVSDADDYRYAGLHGEPARLREVRLPHEIAERCIKTATSMGLHVAGIDLRLTPDGRWFCFEVNPSPGFNYYEANTGQPIADAIASFLCRH